MHPLLQKLRKKAAGQCKTIVFPEGSEKRTMKACAIIAKQKIARPILLGDENEIRKKAEALHLSLKGIKVIDIALSPKKELYAQAMFSIRKKRGKDKAWTFEKCKQLIELPMYFGVMMLANGDADGCIAGALQGTAETLRPALQLIGTQEQSHVVSGVFLMLLKNKMFLFADCSTTVDPNAEQLSQIAIDTANTASFLGISPKVAMLSFSTMHSAEHPLVDKVRNATLLAQKKAKKSWLIEGPLQLDAAIDKEVAQRKFPEGKIKGEANVFIFPSLEAGNIGYKLVQRFAGARAIGPFSQGLLKPVNDLSRGCSVEDIADAAAFTALQGGKKI